MWFLLGTLYPNCTAISSATAHKSGDGCVSVVLCFKYLPYKNLRGCTKMKSMCSYPCIVQPYHPQKEQGTWWSPRSTRTFPRICNEYCICPPCVQCVQWKVLSIGAPNKGKSLLGLTQQALNSSFSGVSLLRYHTTISADFLVCFFIHGTSCISCEFLWLSVIIRSNFQHAAGGKITVGTRAWPELSCCKAT